MSEFVRLRMRLTAYPWALNACGDDNGLALHTDCSKDVHAHRKPERFV